MPHRIRSAALLGASLLGLTACTSELPESPTSRTTQLTATSGPSASRSPEVDRQLVRLHASLGHYPTPEAAIASGWSSLVTDCMTDPVLGGMGFHYADVARFDTIIDPNRPEILVYAPQNGVLRPVAYEFAVPLAAWRSSHPPRVLGENMHVNAEFGLWVLHAWVGQSNPSGVFADWNPTVSCASAPTAPTSH